MKPRLETRVFYRTEGDQVREHRVRIPKSFRLEAQPDGSFAMVPLDLYTTSASCQMPANLQGEQP